MLTKCRLAEKLSEPRLSKSQTTDIQTYREPISIWPIFALNITTRSALVTSSLSSLSTHPTSDIAPPVLLSETCSPNFHFLGVPLTVKTNRRFTSSG